MKKGIVVEIQHHKLIVLTKEGSFQKINRTHRQAVLGDEIIIPEARRVVKRSTRPIVFIAALAAAMLLIFAALVQMPGPIESFQVAYVHLDINPSIEIELSDNMTVIGLKGLNHEGEQIIEELIGWKGKSFEDAALALVELAKAKGFISEEQNDVLISTVYLNQAFELQFSQLFDQTMYQLIEKSAGAPLLNDESDEPPVRIHHFQSSKEVHEKANQIGVSVGKYKVLEKAIEQDPTISVEELSKKSVAQIASQLGGLGQIVSNANRAENPGNSGNANTAESPGNSSNANRAENPGNSSNANRVENPGNSSNANRAESPGNSGNANGAESPGNSGNANRAESPGNSSNASRP